MKSRKIVSANGSVKSGNSWMEFRGEQTRKHRGKVETASDSYLLVVCIRIRFRLKRIYTWARHANFPGTSKFIERLAGAGNKFAARKLLGEVERRSVGKTWRFYSAHVSVRPGNGIE